jgi:hypothetical protein
MSMWDKSHVGRDAHEATLAGHLSPRSNMVRGSEASASMCFITDIFPPIQPRNSLPDIIRRPGMSGL